LSQSHCRRVVGSAATIVLLATGCGSQHHATHTATYGENTQLVPNDAPDGGATSIADALARFRSAATRGDAAEICRLSIYVPKGDCASQWAPLYRRLRAVSTRVISTEHTGPTTTVVLETTYRRGRKLLSVRGNVGFGYRHGRWFVGVVAR
jgi:hypothetical protein